MSKIKNGGLDQYGTEPFEQQQFWTAGVEGVNYENDMYCRWLTADADVTTWVRPVAAVDVTNWSRLHGNQVSRCWQWACLEKSSIFGHAQYLSSFAQIGLFCNFYTCHFLRAYKRWPEACSDDNRCTAVGWVIWRTYAWCSTGPNCPDSSDLEKDCLEMSSPPATSSGIAFNQSVNQSIKQSSRD